MAFVCWIPCSARTHHRPSDHVVGEPLLDSSTSCYIFFNTYYSYTYSIYITTKYGSKLVLRPFSKPAVWGFVFELLPRIPWNQGIQSLLFEWSNLGRGNESLPPHLDLSPQLDVSVQVLKSDHELYRMVGSLAHVKITGTFFRLRRCCIPLADGDFL